MRPLAPEDGREAPWRALGAPKRHLRLAWVGAWVRMVLWTLLAVVVAIWIAEPDLRVWVRDPVGTWTAVELEQVTDILDREARRDGPAVSPVRIRARSGELRQIEDIRIRWRRLRQPIVRLFLVMGAWGCGGLLALALVDAGGRTAVRVARFGGLLAVLWLVLQAEWDAEGYWWPVLWVLPAALAIERAMLWLLLCNRCAWPFGASAPPESLWRPARTHIGSAPEGNGPTEPPTPSGARAPLPDRAPGESLQAFAARLRAGARQQVRARQNRESPALGRRWREACATGTTIGRVDLAREALATRPAWLGLMAHDDPDAVRQALLEDAPGQHLAIGRPLWRLPFLGQGGSLV